MTRGGDSLGQSPANDELKALGLQILDRFSKGLPPVPTIRSIFAVQILKPSTLPGLGLLAVISALSGTAIVVILNKEASLIQEHKFEVIWAILFVISLLVYRSGKMALVAHSSRAIEQALDEWRRRISRKITLLSLRDKEELTRSYIIQGTGRFYEQLSQAVVPMVSGVESIILFIFMLAYVFFISISAGFMTVVVVISLIIGYLNVADAMQLSMQNSSLSIEKLNLISEDVVDGFSELKFSKMKRDAINIDLDKASGEVSTTKSILADLLSNLISFGSSSAYLLTAAIVFVLPIVSPSDAGVYKIVTAVLLLLGPIGGLIGVIQQFSTIQFATKSIQEFEQRLSDKIGFDENSPGPDYSAFTKLGISHANYSHVSEDGVAEFSVANLSADFQRGQIVFITGGNGSGKTTALRLLTGLYPLKSGQICVDGLLVPTPVPQSYRDLFSVIFADYHTFNRAYGLDPEGLARFDQALCELKIRDKCPADLSGPLNRDALSTGQRKRLALALALAEDRPVLVLDEWAADQDPITRERLYRQILPNLKASGKTIIAVTHDDRYFEYADVRYHMSEGRLEKVI